MPYHPQRLAHRHNVSGRTDGELVPLVRLSCSSSIRSLPSLLTRWPGAARPMNNFSPSSQVCFSVSLFKYFFFTWCFFFLLVGCRPSDRPSLCPPSHREETRRGLEERKWRCIQCPTDTVGKMRDISVQNLLEGKHGKQSFLPIRFSDKDILIYYITTRKNI